MASETACSCVAAGVRTENPEADPALTGSLLVFLVAVTMSTIGIINMTRLAAEYRRRAADDGAMVLRIHRNKAISEPCQMK